MLPRPLSSLLVVSLLVLAPRAEAAPPPEEPALVVGTKSSLPSFALNETRPYLVSLPPGYEKSTERYPVLYLLDGDVNFHHVTGVVSFLARNEFIPPMIVVAVSNTDRTRDFTPSLREGFRLPAQPTKLAREVLPTAGGADRFLRFLEEELAPHIEARYRTRPYRILVGHSYGGLFAVHTLLNRPRVFQAYIVISPSLWWNDAQLVGGAVKALERLPAQERFLYMSMGSEGSDMLEPIQRLAATLEKARPARLRWHYAFLEKDHHGSTPLRTLYDGLSLLFEGWIVPEYPATPATLAKLEANYALLTRRLGYEVRPAESILNDVGYQLLGSGQRDAALVALRRNAEWYPGSANTHDSLGEALEAVGQLEAARDSYTRALKLDITRPAFQNHLEAVTRKLASKPPPTTDAQVP